MEYGLYGDLIIMYPKPSSIYLRVTIGVKGLGLPIPKLLKDKGVPKISGSVVVGLGLRV